MMAEEHDHDHSMMPKYFWYVVTLFVAYYLADLPDLLKDSVSATAPLEVLRWSITLLLLPFLSAGVCAGINDRQAGCPPRGVAGFLRNGFRFFLRFFCVRLLFVAMSLVVVVSLAIALSILAAGTETGEDSSQSPQLFLFLLVPLRAVYLFWCAGIVVEGGRLGRSLMRGVRLLATNPAALALGLLWGGTSVGEQMLDGLVEGSAAAAGVAAAKEGVLAILGVAVFAYAIGAYRKAKAEVHGEALDEEPVPGMRFSEQWQAVLVAACGWLAIVSFVPLVSFVALGVGIVALVRGQRFSMRAVCAACLGGFFSVAYVLGTMGWFLPRGAPPTMPGYQFLAEADPSLQEAVTLFEGGQFWAAEEDLAKSAPKAEEQTWAYHCAVGIARTHAGSIDAAVVAFERGLDLEPEGGAFHYYHGLALIDQTELRQAAASFRLALERDPGIEDAQRQLHLIANAHEPSQIETAIGFVVVLLFLFTIHEYAHGYAAWKLGDDTAKAQGRLTLNPLVHLDLFGSLILPALLVFQQSEVVFGWAKPVPVNTENFANPRKDHTVVSFAGPAVNLAVAMAGFLALMVLAFGMRLVAPGATSLNLANPFIPVAIIGAPAPTQLAVVFMLLKQLVFTSLVLGFFNLIPVPPLDGSWILSGILPESAAGFFEKLRPYGFILFLALVFTPLLDVFLAIPLGFAYVLLLGAFAALGFG
jgi:Zn-dependent protease